MSTLSKAIGVLDGLLDRILSRPKLVGFAPGDTVNARNTTWKVEKVGSRQLQCERQINGNVERRSFLPSQVAKMSWADQIRDAAEASRDPRDRLMDSMTKTGKLPPEFK